MGTYFVAKARSPFLFFSKVEVSACRFKMYRKSFLWKIMVNILIPL